jgi:tRNA(His) guanylyltransferase
MNRAATHVLRQLPDVDFAYGVSDEYSFVFDRHTTLFERRRDKLCSTVVSTFTAAYVAFWDECFGGGLVVPEGYAPASKWVGVERAGLREMEREGCNLSPDMFPSFDARAVVYPTTANLRDYLSWRQVDCHINNLYNTTFWFMVCKGGMSERDAEEELKGTLAKDKDMEERGGDPWSSLSKTQREKLRRVRLKAAIVVEHVDIIKDDFWEKRPWILGGKAKMGKG